MSELLQYDPTGNALTMSIDGEAPITIAGNGVDNKFSVVQSGVPATGSKNFPTLGQVQALIAAINTSNLDGVTYTQFTNSASGSNATINAASGNVQLLTLTDNCNLTINPVNTTAGFSTRIILIVEQGTGAPFTINWPNGTIFSSGKPPTLNVNAGAYNIFTLTQLAGTTTWILEDPALNSSSGGPSGDILTGVLYTQASQNSGTSAVVKQSLGNIQFVTLTADCTITFEAGSSKLGIANTMTLVVEQGTGGPYTITWPSGTIFNSGTAPTLSSVVGGFNLFYLVLLSGSSNWILVSPEGASLASIDGGNSSGNVAAELPFINGGTP